MEKEIKKLDKKYADHFVEARKLSVKRNGKEIDDKVIDKLMNALGEEFDQIFDCKVEIGTKKGLAEIFHTLPEEVQSMLKQAKASTRNVTIDGKVC